MAMAPPYPNPYGYGGGSCPGFAAPPPYGATPGAAAAPNQALDMASLQAGLHSATAGPSSSGSNSDCYLDTGATAHMSANPGTLSSLRPSSTSASIFIGNGDHLPITHVGTGSIIWHITYSSS